jgi:uncharacterized membrane protein
MPRHTQRHLPIPAGLIVLTLVPILAGIMRVTEIASSPVPTPENARFLVHPVAIYLHAGGGSLYLLLGAFQFYTPLRMRSPRWHRIAGRVAVTAGLSAAFAGLWMTQTFPAVPGNPALLYGFRVTFGLGWIICLMLGLWAALQRDIPAHRAWMMRGYAIGLGAGTTVLTYGGWLLVGGTDSTLVTTLTNFAAWVINLAVAEVFIQRHSRRRPLQLTKEVN